MAMKKCSGCQETKPPAVFSRQAASGDGLKSRCKVCMAAYDRNYLEVHGERKRASNRKSYAASPKKQRAPSVVLSAEERLERSRASSRKWNAANPEKRSAWNAANPEKVAAYARAYHAANPEKALAYREANRAKASAAARVWTAANPEKKLAYNRKYRAENRERLALAVSRRRAHKQANGVFLITPKETRRLLSQPCYLCGIAPSTDVEHIIPLSRGGRHSIGNILGACKSCNSRKHNKLLVEYRRRPVGVVVSTTI